MQKGLPIATNTRVGRLLRLVGNYFPVTLFHLHDHVGARSQHFSCFMLMESKRMYLETDHIRPYLHSLAVHVICPFARVEAYAKRRSG